MPGSRSASNATRVAGQLGEVAGRLAGQFTRSEPRQRAIGYIRALLSNVGRKNGWQVAGHLGEATPDGVQHLLARATWDADAVRDELFRYVTDRLGCPDGVLVVGGTTFPKKGVMSVGVEETGTTNSQTGVFLGYVSARGQTLIDRELYLPEVWARDRERRARAGVPTSVKYATWHELAIRMIRRAVNAGVPAKWVRIGSTGGEFGTIRAALEGMPLGYLTEVKTGLTGDAGFRQTSEFDFARDVPPDDWQKHQTVGPGGLTTDVWAAVKMLTKSRGTHPRWVLLRRYRDRLGLMTSVETFAAACPSDTPVSEMARVVGTRWEIGQSFERARRECGLGDYEVRSWTGWYRHVTLSLFALAVLSAARARGTKTCSNPQRKPG